jgi:predicted RNA-binding protein with TRAM domain
VIRLWEKDNEDNGILDLTEVVEQLRNKTDTKLKEISLPFSQYESLKGFENKYSVLKEENDKLKVDYKNLEDKNKEFSTTHEHLKKELTHLKENPIVKEKIVYKENTTEFNEIKAECERLRLKLFNYETGHMKMPTHGINVGNIYKVIILGVGKDGDGFTRVNNFIIFVPDTNKDQEVNIKITRVLKKYAFGKTVEDVSGEQVLDATSGMVTQPTAELPTTSQPEEAPEKDANENMDKSTSETK